MPFPISNLSSLPYRAYQSASDLSTRAYQQVKNSILPNTSQQDPMVRLIQTDINAMYFPPRHLRNPLEPEQRREALMAELGSYYHFLAIGLIQHLNPFKPKGTDLLKGYSALVKASQEASPEIRKAHPPFAPIRETAPAAMEDAMGVALTHPHKTKSDQAWKDVNYLILKGVKPTPAMLNFALKRKDVIEKEKIGSLRPSPTSWWHFFTNNRA